MTEEITSTMDEAAYLFRKWVENRDSSSSRQFYMMALIQLGLKPTPYRDASPDGELMTHDAPEGVDTKLERKFPGKPLPGSVRIEVNNRLQVEGDDYAVDYLTGEVTWLKSANFALDPEDYVFYQCELSPV